MAKLCRSMGCTTVRSNVFLSTATNKPGGGYGNEQTKTTKKRTFSHKAELATKGKKDGDVCSRSSLNVFLLVSTFFGFVSF